MESSAELDTGLLVDLRRHRRQLRHSMGGVERALAFPVAAQGTQWAEGVRLALVELYDDFREHVAMTEGPTGLYRELTASAGRLAGPIELLTREHAQIMRRIEELLTWVDIIDAVPDANEVRRIGTELLAALMRHRQRGADLVFEAYEVDLGGET